MRDWTLEYEGYDPAQERLRESLCTLGNGYFATRGAAPECAADAVHYPGTYAAGCYNRLTSDVAGRRVENEDMVNLPNWLRLRFRTDTGTWLSPDTRLPSMPGVPTAAGETAVPAADHRPSTSVRIPLPACAPHAAAWQGRMGRTRAHTAFPFTCVSGFHDGPATLMQGNTTRIGRCSLGPDMAVPRLRCDGSRRHVGDRVPGDRLMRQVADIGIRPGKVQGHPPILCPAHVVGRAAVAVVNADDFAVPRDNPGRGAASRTKRLKVAGARMSSRR